MITHHSEIQHKLNVLRNLNTRLEYIPASARFNFFLTCCNDLKNDAQQQSDAETVNRGIETLQLLIRKNAINTVEREIKVLKKKMINHVFYFTLKVMKTGLILFKTKHYHLTFTQSQWSLYERMTHICD